MTDVTWNPAGDDDTSFGPLTAHNVLGGRTAADAHPAAAVSYDNDVSGLTGDTVQEAIDELATSGGAVASVNGETGVVVLDAADVGAVPVESVGLLPGETNRGTWDVAATYAVGDVVAASGSVYVASAASTGLDPASNPGSWDEIVDFSYRTIELGPGSSATSDASIAIGYGSSATGDGSTAIAPESSATGVASTAIGFGSSATGDGDINIGDVFRGSVDDPFGARTPDAASITTGFVDLPETAVATNPAADHQRLIARTDGLYVRDQAGTEVGPLGAGGGGIPETLIDAAGDLIVGTAADTAGRLALGAAGTVLTSTGSAAGWQATRHGLTVPLPSAIGFHRRIGSNVSMDRGTVWWIRIPEIAHDAKVTHVWIDTATGVSSCTATGAIVSTTTAGKPGTVLASTAVGAIGMSVSAAMNGAALSSPYTLTTGGNYWVAVLALGGASDPAVRGADGVEGWLNVKVGTAPVTPATNNTYGCLRLTGQASIPDTPAAIVGNITPVVYLSVEAP